ncbi:MAG: hypothetical protein OXH38_05300 [Chloroflexi bacterium]|nr:hypothetical protein [Chloroflexota bacterium]
MGKFADAIRDRRKGGQRRLGFGASVEQRQPSMLVGAVGAVDCADFCLATDDESMSQIASSEAALWGARVEPLTADGVARAKEQGASFVAFTIDEARADALLDEDLDYVVRLTELRIEESDARALASLRPAEVAAPVEFPVSVETVLQLRRLALLIAAPIGVRCPSDVSDGDLQALRDSGVAVVALGPDATADEISSLKERIADLPERNTRGDSDTQPLIPTLRAGGDAATDDD